VNNVQPKPIRWQYQLVWTPGPEHSMVHLWATSSHGVRTLWDSWEAPGFPETPSLHAVLHHLYMASCEGQERQSHVG